MKSITELPSLNEFYSNKYIKSTEWNNLVLFHYTNECVYNRAWDNVTLNARGIIFNKNTGELVARPWKKFFNLSEMPHTRLELLNDPFYVLDKWDGSMGILYKYENEFYIATKGSFTSDQALWATNWARKSIDFSNIDNDLTYLFEIIYPANKIVIDYGNREFLILTGVVNKKNGKEEGPDGLQEWGNLLNIGCAANHSFKSLDELSNYCKTLSSQHEGFVVTFPSTGLKIKVKGDEYLKIHKIISNLTPLAFWEAWDIKEKKIPDFYLMQVPEEFKTYTDELSEIINKIHQDYYTNINIEYREVLKKLELIFKNIPIKEFAIEVQNNYRKNMSLLINLFKNQNDKLWDEIHKRVRPNANILPKKYQIKCDIYGRLNRVLDDF